MTDTVASLGRHFGAGFGATLIMLAQNERYAIAGAACLGGALMGALATILSDKDGISWMNVAHISPIRRFFANWLFALFAIPITPYVHNKLGEEWDLLLVSFGLAALLAFIGLVLFSLIGPALLKRVKKAAETQRISSTAPTQKLE